jgi:hypothetical protein
MNILFSETLLKAGNVERWKKTLPSGGWEFIKIHFAKSGPTAYWK